MSCFNDIHRYCHHSSSHSVITKRIDSHEDDGFSLIVFITVITVLGILAAISVPGWKELSGIKLSAAARRVTGDLRYIQDLAIRTGEAHTVKFYSRGYRIFREGQGLIEDPSNKGRPFVVDLNAEYPGIKLSASFNGRKQLTFQNRGDPSNGGSVMLTLAGEVTRVKVEAGTGRISY